VTYDSGGIDMRTRIRALGLMLALVALPDVVKAERIVLDFERFPGPDGQLGTARRSHTRGRSDPIDGRIQQRRRDICARDAPPI